MIIEFFGVPGGGKTQILRQLTTLIPNAGESLVPSRRAIAFGTLHFALRHPLSFLIWMSELAVHANGLFRYKLGLLLRSMAMRTYSEAAARSSVTFIDEGLLQRMLTIFDNPLSPRHIKFLLRMTPRPDAVIVVRGGEFGRFTAAPNRLNSPRAKKGEKLLQEWMRNVRATAEVAELVLPEYTHVIACTQGGASADPSAICSRIEEYRDNRRL